MMSFRSSSLITLGILILITVTFISSTKAQIPDIEVMVGDTTAYPGKKNTVISIFLTNRVDTVSGFNLWLQLDRPDIMNFQIDTSTVYDTTYWKCLSYFGEDCVDSQLVLDPAEANFFHVNIYLDTIGNFDTTGTLCSGWELIDSRSLSGVGTDINIAGIADLPGGGGRTAGIPPSYAGGLLIKILADVFFIPDTLTDRTVNLLVQTQFKDHFGFSDPSGASLGYYQQEVEDTTCFVCTDWVWDGTDSICYNYQIITYGTCDSIYTYLDTVSFLDTNAVKVTNGSLTVLPGSVCGNIDGEVEPVLEIDIGDLVYFVDWAFNDGPAPNPQYVANLNCDNEDGDIADLVMMVDYMFNDGPVICECWGN